MSREELFPLLHLVNINDLLQLFLIVLENVILLEYRNNPLPNPSVTDEYSGDVALVKIAHKTAKLLFLDIAFQNTFKRVQGAVVFPKNFE